MLIDRFLLDLRRTHRITEAEYALAYADRPILHNAVRTVAASVVSPRILASHRVFGIVELLEVVLDHLTPIEQLRARTVSKSFQRVIEESPILTVKRSQQSASNGPLMLPPYNIRGMRLTLSRARGIPSVSAVLDMGLHSRLYRRVLRRSLMLRKILISQPPPFRMRLSADCRCRSPRSWLVERTTGITFGDVFSAVDTLKGSSCRDCRSKYYIRVRGLHIVA